MTSAKYYSNWLKEAGRGHISAILAWGGFALYLIFKVMSLSIDTDFAFSGIGSAELSYLCMGLGILLAFSEFGYLFQAKKQDFYFSLPVKRSTIFWTHYFHGLLHFAFPFLITQAACALYQASRDTVFASYASGYTVRSVIVFLLVFLLFYHMGLLAAAVSGRVAFAWRAGRSAVLFRDPDTVRPAWNVPRGLPYVLPHPALGRGRQNAGACKACRSFGRNIPV